jgi:hypothetical protein
MKNNYKKVEKYRSTLSFPRFNRGYPLTFCEKSNQANPSTSFILTLSFNLYPLTLITMKKEFENELTDNILNYWVKKVYDPQRRTLSG